MWALVILMAISLVYSSITGYLQKPKEISLSEVVAHINAAEVASITVADTSLEVKLKNGDTLTAQKEAEAGLIETLRSYGVAPEKLKDVQITVKAGNGFGPLLGLMLPVLAPVLLIAFFMWFSGRQIQRGTSQAFSFGQSRARLISPESEQQKTTFKDVAGVKEAKEELREVVDFLKNPKKYIDIGAKIPKGVLLIGAPGTGKSLLAKAVSGEAGVPFFHLSASEFIEMFVGVGASVTGDTPVLIRENGVARLVPIREVVDKFYSADGENIVMPVSGIETLGIKPGATGFRGLQKNKDKLHLGGSRFVPVQGVLRHRVKEIYEIYYHGGMVRTTGDHSIFVREKNFICSKRAVDLKAGDVLVNLPYKVRSVFILGIGTTHKIKAHEFDAIKIPEIVVWADEYRQTQEKYDFAFAHADGMTQKEIGHEIGVSQSAVGLWLNGTHRPKFFNSPSIHHGLPARVLVTPDLMRLFGYYVAEGRTTSYYMQFVFGAHEKELHEDCVSLLKNIFSLLPRIDEITETNSTRITVSSRTLADMFEREFGTGSHQKHLPVWIWDLPWEYIHAFIKGYARGDGYTTQDQKLSMTSVSRQLIRELAWLLSMHGIQAGIRKNVCLAGRRIGTRGKPLPETISWNLIIGKTSNLWSSDRGKSPNQFKKPKVLKVVRQQYDDYVYDLVGCEGEAFFGGEKPTLLHNSRVRDTFRLAKKAAPAIIFIDELDAVGRIRGGSGFGGGHDEREQTLNQLLVEMDGMETSDKVLIFSATNRPDVLDPALLRPGRFDRRVVLDLPDINDREEILKIHMRNKPVVDEVALRVIAERTPGFSGADLANLVNEAAISAARGDRKKVEQIDLINSIEKVLLGPERKSHLLSSEEKKISAYHEAGHALVAASLPHADPVHKVSIVSRGRAAGYTLKLPSEDRHLYRRSHFLAELASALGGFAAEQMLFGEITTGPHDDLKKATDLARSLVVRFGMSDKIGPLTLDGQDEMVFLGRELSTGRNYSEETARVVDSEVKRLMDEALATAKKILKERRETLDAIAAVLIEKETIEREAFEKIVGSATNGFKQAGA